MEKVFLNLLDMNITACYVILCVILIRLVLKKAPRIFSYLLWSAVLFRLVCPVSFESIFSLVPGVIRSIPLKTSAAAGIPVYEQPLQLQGGPPVIGRGNDLLSVQVSGSGMTGSEMVRTLLTWGEFLWLIVMTGLLIYGIVTAVSLQRNLRSAVHLEDNIYEYSGSKTPFVFGILHPRIYLPAGITGSEKRYILKHEQIHINRYDHIVKMIAFFVLSLHWLNPFVWIAFFLMNEDMEVSCDESVIKQMGNGIKKEYSSSLLSLSTGKRRIGGCPLAFGENNIKVRINRILQYKKPAFWAIITAAVVVAAVCAALVSNPQSKELTVADYADQFVKDQISSYESLEWTDFKIVDSKIIKLEKVNEFPKMLEDPVEIWRIEYRLKPDDISKVMLAGGMNEIDGWLTEDSSMGKPFLVVSYQNTKPEYLGCIYSGDGVNGNMDTVPGRETALRVFLEDQNRLPHETYPGNHIVVKFPLSTGETCQLFLSKPVDRGTSGIWCVERWMDGNGTIYYDTPETDGFALDYYKDLQLQCDNGHNPWLTAPLEVAQNYINHVLGQSVKLTDLTPQYQADVKDFEETPESRYIGYISEFNPDLESDRFSFHLDPVEWLTLDDRERLENLQINPDDLSDGYYIYNPNTYPLYFQGTEKTRFRVVDGVLDAGHKDMTEEEFNDYLEKFMDGASPFWIVTKDGFVQSIEEQSIP